MKDRSYNLYGSQDSQGATTFTGEIQVDADLPFVPEFWGICFQGNGGTGISASTGLALRECTIAGWDIGAVAQDGGWIAVQDCTFRENGVGLHFNTAYYEFNSPDYFGNSFEENETAVRLTRCPGTETLNFSGSVFSRNLVDFENPDGQPLDILQATFQ